ncbi:MAG TPA: carboxypeptidase-like regulatory domain-containing protein [Blastocatellia bacterium]|nr:carboxypeptidase-like regulatory domain-containing protein [Blastocatellia bacterium]
MPYRPGTAYLQIEQVFKGAVEKQITFPQGTGGDCIPVYSKGQRWLIYATRDKSTGMLYPMGCSRNSTIEHAANDLMYLRALPGIATKTRLAGTVTRYDDVPGAGFDFVKNLPGTKVRATDEQGRTYETICDSNGVCEFVGLPAGKYRVHAEIPHNLRLVSWQLDNSWVEVKEGNCAGLNVTTHSDGRIAGSVIDSEGRSVAGIYVQLYSLERIDRIGKLNAGKWVSTNKEGKFEFKEIPAGRYLLGVNLDQEPRGDSPYPRTFYPGVDNLARATVVNVGDLEQLRDYDIHLPPRLVTRTVEGVVYFSDGRLVTDGNVSIKESEEINVMRGYASGRIDGQGRFSLQVLDGTKGWLHAYGLPDGLRLGMRMLYIKPVKIEVFQDSKDLKIIIPLKEGEKTPVK